VKTSAGDLVIPLFDPSLLALAALWALAAAALPLLVRGRGAVPDLVGALIWAAGLISAHRLIAGPGSEPEGLLLAATAAACLTALAAPRLRPREPRVPTHLSGADTGVGA
jgi:hypothetical protein